MILTCPSCATRYSVDGAKFPAGGRTVRCSNCGQSWQQMGEVPQSASSESVPPVSARPQSTRPESAGQEPSGQESTPPPASSEAQGPAPSGPSPEAAAAPFARGGAAPPPSARRAVPPGLAVAAGWVALIVVVLLIVVSAVRYRQDIATVWPQSAGVYSSLGLPVSAGGIDFRQVSYKRNSQNGQVVLSVSGRIVNTARRELPVPQTVCVTLSDADNRELYHWTFKSGAATLKPGQSVPFVTQLSSPPALARHLEVRFLKDAQ